MSNVRTIRRILTVWPILTILTILCILMTGCATPAGNPQLSRAIRNDRAYARQSSNVLQGKTLFMKAYKYPQISNGDIEGECWVWVNVGRESLTIEDLRGK